LNRGAEKQKYVIDIDLSNVNINFETKTINFKQAENTELEENVYKIESYFNTFIQISKNFSSTNRYPLCQELEFDNKSASMDVRINSIIKFLLKSSDILIVTSTTKWIQFQLDYSVYNSLSTKIDLSRVEIKLNLNNSHKFSVSTIEPPKITVALKNQIKIVSKSLNIKRDSFIIGSQLTVLSKEIQFTNGINQSFKSFSLNFQIVNPVDFIYMTKNFGIVYFNSETREGDVVRLKVECNY
jgi:hypothetical protein